MRRDRERRSVVALALGTALAATSMRAEAPATGNPIAVAFALVFDSEVIRLDVVADSLQVTGKYVLLCREPIRGRTPLFYPFPVDSLLGGARMVSLTGRAGSGPPVDVTWQVPPTAPGVRWWLPPCHADTLMLTAVYRQKLESEYARYIVTSTQAWGRPLRHAVFEIHLPPGATPTAFSDPFAPRGEGDQISYVFEARDFMPVHDITVRWARSR